MSDLPFISAICPVYGRVRLLEEAIACFMLQDYQGKHELVVLNSFPRQTLLGMTFPPNVRLINLPARPGSLGECRNIAIKETRGEVIITWDSDDLFLPHYLSLFAKHFTEGIDWVWLSRQFYAEKFRIREVMSGQLNSVAFTKAAWENVGGYDPVTVGEDRQFVGKLTAQTKGVKVDVLPRDIGLIYSWGNNTYKTSGFGDDKITHQPAYQRVEHEVQRAINAGNEPVGDIVLKPTLVHDPVKMAAAFLQDRGLLVDKKNSVCIVELGRYGDIVNILPIAKHISEVYGKPHFMVSREFASILEGVSYVEPYIVDLDNSQLNEAMAIARKEFKYVIQTQIWGKNYFQEKLCRSYNEESWRMGGFWSEFNNEGWIPEFDRRDDTRESALLKKLSVTGKPLLLVNATSSVSSPFPHGTVLLNAIRAVFDTCEIINLAELQATRIYDVLGLMDAAECLVSIDSAQLHLAAATIVPTVAIVNSHPWSGTIPRCNCVARIKYDECVLNGLVNPVVFEAIEKALEWVV